MENSTRKRQTPSETETSTAKRAPKRVRQACEPCRRKKSRCLGERPECSHCSRLGQACEYSNNAFIEVPLADDEIRDRAERFDTSQDREDNYGALYNSRLNTLETKLAEVLQALQNRPSSIQQQWSPGHLQEPSTSIAQQWVRATSGVLPPWDVISSAAELYISFCNCQPLPLFSSQNFLSTISDRDPELLFSILAIATRFAKASSRVMRNNDAKTYAESASKIVMGRISQGPIELSTLQSLCLLALFEFQSDNSHRASMYSSLALDLAQSAGIHFESQSTSNELLRQEQRRCFWSVVLLKRLFGVPDALLSFTNDSVPSYPESIQTPPPSSPGYSTSMTNPTVPRAFTENSADLGILAFAIQLSEIWQRTARYVCRRASSETHPPWSSDSEYSKIMFRKMELETRMPYQYRFRPSKFAEQSIDHLNQSRDYWGPWLFVQLIYHTNICLLNHPLLLSLRLRSFKVTMIPEIFLQHTAELIRSHTEWVTHLIEVTESKGFAVSDPFLAHCVAVVATIYLQQSYADNPTIRETKKNCFTKCLAFVSRSGQWWPHIQRLADKLRRFQGIVSESYQNSAASDSPDDSVLINLTLFWEILESNLVRASPDESGSLFGSSLLSHRRDLVNAEVLNPRLLPQPTHVDSRGGPVAAARIDNLQNARTAVPLSTNDLSGSPDLSTWYPSSSDGLATMLAQSYFAQGQDFLKNTDEWWNIGNL